MKMPNPGTELILRVAGGPDHSSFFWSGKRSVQELERTLGIVGRSLRSFESILDFGCGCGRMLLWMEDVGRAAALHGTDIDAEAIEWCASHIPYAAFTVNSENPPLPYVAASFDLVVNHSVFTHIDERRQDEWLAELRRVARPGALLVLSTHGEGALPDGAWEIRDRLEQDGIAYVDTGSPIVGALPDWYQNTWHAPWYVLERWSRWFEIRGYVPRGDLDFQDHWLLERRADDSVAGAPLAARPVQAAAGGPARRVSRALSEARAYRNAATPIGRIRGLARRLVLRGLRPYSLHEDKFDDAVSRSIAELTRISARHATEIDALNRRLNPDD
jgi:SAM-dependent methyltransferase